MVINVYSQYFQAQAHFSGVERRGAYFEKEIYHAPGRRSRKREAAFLESLREEVDTIAAEHDAVVDWEHPLNEARMG